MTQTNSPKISSRFAKIALALSLLSIGGCGGYVYAQLDRTSDTIHNSLEPYLGESPAMRAGVQTADGQEPGIAVPPYKLLNPALPGLQNPTIQFSVYLLKDAVYSNAYATRRGDANYIQAVYDAYSRELVRYNRMPNSQSRLTKAYTGLLTLLDTLEKDRDYHKVLDAMPEGERLRRLRHIGEARHEANRVFERVFEHSSQANSIPKSTRRGPA